MQGLPSLNKFSGENVDSEEDGFDKWLEVLEERAYLAGWSEEHKLYQLKMHLERTALQIFRMMPESSRKVYKEAVEYLKGRFKPIDIEELKGIEFHQKMQGAETIEQLGITLQKLGRKAFPGTSGKEFDRLLKGRFFKALHTKWQRKLGAPKPGETFGELYDRARTLERHEKQFSETAAASKERKSVSGGDKQVMISEAQVRSEEGGKDQPQAFRGANTNAPCTRQRVECHRCKNLGHYAQECPFRANKSESLGQSTSRSATLTAVPVETNSSLGSFSIEQLEQHLAQRRLSSELSLMQMVSQGDAHVGVVMSDGVMSDIVGPTPYLDVVVEGVPVKALVDSGSQSTLISRSMLHRVAAKLRAGGGQLPKLTLPTVKLYGKDG